MQELPKRFEAQCANCKQPIDVNRYIIKAPEDSSLGSIHLMKDTEGFAGAVRCPACQHFTIYTRR